MPSPRLARLRRPVLLLLPLCLGLVLGDLLAGRGAAREASAAAPPPIVDGAAPDDAQKLRELYASAALFRQKLATIEAKPEDQRFGLEMTRKLLHTLETEIAALTSKYSAD